MALAHIQVTVSQSVGLRNKEPNVELLRAALQNTEPGIISVTNEYVLDLYTMHCLIKLKLARTPHIGFAVETEIPEKVGHAIKNDTGEWIDVGTGVALVYKAKVVEPSATFFIGFEAVLL